VDGDDASRAIDQKGSVMNTTLWIVQALLAFQAFAGGVFKLARYEDLAKSPAGAALSRVTWGAIGAFELVCAVLLIVPMATGWMPGLTPMAAVALVVESLALAAFYASYSRAFVATNPLVYVLGSAAVAALIAWGRFGLMAA
jgi:hypothetical protein